VLALKVIIIVVGETDGTGEAEITDTRPEATPLGEEGRRARDRGEGLIG
jgi:hypothetical protein